jgi:hypothetical protein
MVQNVRQIRSASAEVAIHQYTALRHVALAKIALRRITVVPDVALGCVAITASNVSQSSAANGFAS